jgi:hypothetical protein
VVETTANIQLGEAVNFTVEKGKKQPLKTALQPEG